MLGYFDIDFQEIDLIKERPNISADIVFYLSMNYHAIGIPDWLADVTNEVCVFEDNSKDRDAAVRLSKLFKKVELVGKTYDHDKTRGKLVYFCHK